jgi:hypothetical protein
VHTSRLQSYLERTYEDNLGTRLLDMKCEQETSLPQQTNGHDCGVFVCLFAERISRSAMFDFVEEDCYYFRLRIASEIQQGRLVVDRCASCCCILVPFDETSSADERAGYPCIVCQAWFHSTCMMKMMNHENDIKDLEHGVVCGMCMLYEFF